MTIQSLNPALLTFAQRKADILAELEKAAIVPAGMGDPSQGGAPPPGDPSQGGGAPPPDPMGGGAAAPPPGGGGDQTSQIAQQVMAMMQQQGMGGGAGGPMGKGGGKKAEQQLTDTKLWIIQYILVQLAEQAGLKLPPSVVVGPPPDPMAMQAAQTESASPTGAGAPMQQGDPSMGGGAPPGPSGPAPMQPMDPSQGPIGKTASWDGFGLGSTVAPDYNAILNGTSGSSLAARTRRVLNG